MDKILNRQNSEQTKSRMDKILNEQNPKWTKFEWTKSQMEKILNWTKSQIGQNITISHGQNPHWTKSQIEPTSKIKNVKINSVLTAGL